MNAIDKARELNKKLKESIKEEKMTTSVVDTPVRGIDAPARVEHHGEVAVKRQGTGIIGLEDIPISIIPLPFYKLVTANSKNVTMANGKRANAGTFFTDLNEEVQSVRVAIIRAKRSTKEVKSQETGAIKQEPVIRLLAVDTSNMSPFIISISKGSFSNFGRMMNWFVKSQVKHVFDYPVVLGTQFIETGDFPYWAMTFAPEKEAFNKEDLDTMAMVYNQYASVLDRDVSEEEITDVTPRDSAGRVVEDIPFGDEPGPEAEQKMPWDGQPH